MHGASYQLLVYIPIGSTLPARFVNITWMGSVLVFYLSFLFILIIQMRWDEYLLRGQHARSAVT